ESLSKSVENSLFVAEKLQLQSIAFPAIGTGVAGFSAEECAKIMLDVFRNFNYTKLEKIILVLYSDEMYSLFLKVAGNKEIEL
ncbi:MAG: macro domain-containing protein, partial [Candidatus Heimdallarchaeota archaeon]